MIDTLLLAQATAIRDLNDQLRTKGIGGRTVLTRGIGALPPNELVAALRAVADFSNFSESNDPYGEHDCAMIEVAGHQVLWKIDYCDPDLLGHSLNAADPAITARVMTIMLADEY